MCVCTQIVPSIPGSKALHRPPTGKDGYKENACNDASGRERDRSQTAHTVKGLASILSRFMNVFTFIGAWGGFDAMDDGLF